MINDYASLQTSVAGWLARADLAGAIPDFIALGEAWINRELRVRQMLKTATGDVDPDGRFLLPDDYIEMLAVSGFRHGQMVPLDNRYFIVDADSVRLSNTTGAYEFSYWARVPALNDAAPQNWLIADEPGIYLYSALVEASPYIQDDARTAIWGTKLNEILVRLNAQDVGARYGTARMRPAGKAP